MQAQKSTGVLIFRDEPYWTRQSNHLSPKLIIPGRVESKKLYMKDCSFGNRTTSPKPQRVRLIAVSKRGGPESFINEREGRTYLRAFSRNSERRSSVPPLKNRMTPENTVSALSWRLNSALSRRLKRFSNAFAWISEYFGDFQTCVQRTPSLSSPSEILD